jgi:pimeloyl-ACP methyl ester carboxylesterase
MKSLRIEGRTRCYEDEGEGPAVVLVHGSLSGARQWRTLWERLRARFRVIAPDLYAGDGMAASFEEDCAFVAALLDAAGGGAYLGGHSYGGVVAARSGLARRDALSGLILIEPSCFHLLRQENADEFAEIAAVRAEQQRLAQAGALEASARFFIGYWMGEAAFDAMPERRRAAIAAGVPRVAQEWRGTWDDVTRLSDYRALTLPALLLHAADTRAPSLRIVAMLRAAMPQASEAEIASGGHMAPLTNPDPVNAAIARFLEGAADGAGPLR